MKKLYSLLLLVVTSLSFGQTFYSENFGTPTGTTLFPAYTTGTAPATFQNSSPILYTGSGDVRTSSASSGYTGASGSGNVFLTSTLGKYLQIDGLNTSTHLTANIQLSFGYITNSITTQLVVEYSTNGSTWSPITFTNNANTSWNLITILGGVIPSSTTLSLRFTQPATAQMRLDDVKLSDVNASCTLVLGTPTTLCDAITLGTDTYTVTIPFTGAGNGTYTITPSSGTVGGDNPTTVAAGNITVSGVTEGTNFSATIVGATCNTSVTATSPECKPVNTLPYSEGFPYTVGNSLNAQQKWTIANSGDNVLVAAGSLTHAGVTSTGNSVTFTATGAESFSPFTNTTSGTLYTAYLFNISELQGVTDGNATYFAAITGVLSSDYKARLFVKRVGEQYQIGFDTAATTTNYDATLRNVGETVYIVIGYDFTNNTLSAWINPVNGAIPSLGIVPATPITSIGGFILRQEAANTTPTIVFDELRVVTSQSELGLTLGTPSNQIAGLSVYPNPVTNGKLFITSENGAEKSIVIYDILGKQVLATSLINDVVNVSGLNAGVYIIKITEAGKIATRKLIIQ